MLRNVLCLIAISAIKVEGELARKLSYAQITGYEPASSVVQHSLIDLDQKEMETHLGAKPTPDFVKAKDIYMNGGNSGGKATITVGALGAAAAKGAEVKQGTVAIGSMKSAATAGATSITVSYKSECKEGGSATKVSTGCFTVAGGDITVGGTSIGAPTEVKNSYRTLAGFSTAAKAKMAQYKIYDNYYKYYGEVGDYANQRVLAALDKTGMCSACDDDAAVQIAKKGTAYMNVWMYVVREFEDAIEDCNEGCIDCNDDPVHAWDEGVAFYSGSLEGTDNANSVSGKLIHALADKRCENFKTCSASGDSTDNSKGSKVNHDFIKQCKEGQAKLLAGKCKEAIPIKDRIIEIMSVPLIQGSLRYAYKVSPPPGQSKKDSKTVAEGAAFSAAILPRVHACDPAAAKTISDNMKEPMHGASSMSDGFAKVKAAFESTYKCMGVTCEDIGGLWLTEDYYEGAAPCKSDDHDHDHGHSGGKPKAMCLDTATAQSHGACMDAKTDTHCYDMGTHKVTCDQACPSGCEAPAKKKDDHDDHEGHDHDGTAAPTTTVDAVAPTTSASVDLKLTPILGALLLAQMALLHHA